MVQVDFVEKRIRLDVTPAARLATVLPTLCVTHCCTTVGARLVERLRLLRNGF